MVRPVGFNLSFLGFSLERRGVLDKLKRILVSLRTLFSLSERRDLIGSSCIQL